MRGSGLPFFSLLIVVVLTGCQEKNPPAWSSADSVLIVNEILSHRVEADSFFRYDPDSPFRRDTSIRYSGIRWYPPNPRLYFKATLQRYVIPETVIVMGTHGEERKHLKYGYFPLVVDGTNIRLNAYKHLPDDPRRYAMYRNHLSIWFTDKTTGRETYEVGRYLDVGTESSDKNFLYTIDFNKAYNPYCAYSDIYSCAIPRREDYLDVEIRAGEMRYAEHH
jgi:uncharacterized protein (DUF1684 family)